MSPATRAKQVLPPFLTASTWGAVFDAAWSRVRDAHGTGLPVDPWPVHDQFGSAPPDSPRLSNAEALALIAGWRNAAGSAFPLWHQYAAFAYGWDPDNGSLDNTPAHGRDSYPEEANAMLWGEMFQLARGMDSHHENYPDPARVDLGTKYDDPDYLKRVATELKADNGGVWPTFKLPTGMCTDRKTGKRRPFRPCVGPTKKDDQGRCYYLDPITGVKRLCDCEGDCKPELVDDPVTAAGKSLFTLVLIGGALWWLWKKERNPRRRRRN